LSKYDQNLSSFNSKKYINNVIKVSKLFDLGNESQMEEILINGASQKLDLNRKKAPVLKNAKVEVDSLDYGVFWKHKEIYSVKENIIPQNSINMCIKCINNYSNKYIAKLLEVSHIDPKQIDTYIIKDSSNILILPSMKSKRRPKEIDEQNRHTYSEKSYIPLFFIKWFNNMLALPILTLIKILGVSHVPRSLIRWIISDKNKVFFRYIVHKNKSRGLDNISLLKNYIVGYLDEIPKKPNYRCVKKGVVSLPAHKDLGLLVYKYKKYSLGISRGRKSNNNKIKSGNIRVFKIESAKFMQLLNFKSFFTLLSSGKGELKLFDRFKVQKTILEGKLWSILNLYLTNNELYSFVLDSLKKQAIKDYSLAKNEIIEPEMLSFYQDKINNITYQAIFKILNNEWYDIKWFISFKFDTVFLDEHRDILIKNLKENINQDYLFIKLINNMFNMEMIGIYNYKSFSRYNLFEHDKLSEFLINIFFCKLDKKVNDLKYNFFNKYYNLLWLKFWNLKLKDQGSNSQMLARDVITKAKFNFKYIRYLDTFIIGINGSKSEVNEIRDVLESFLKSELQLNNLHSYIIDIHNDNLKFMSINISSGLFYGNKYKILFLFPKELIIKALINTGILSNKNIPICKKNLLKYNLNIIINTYIDINYFVLSSFAICHDFSKLNRLLSYYINCSLKLTLQAKLGNKLWNRVITPITPLRKDSKTYRINNYQKFVWQKSMGSMKKKLGQSNFNILLLFRLGLISYKIFKKLYYFRVNNKKYLKRKYANKNCDSNINNINWESGVNFDFLISNYYDYYTRTKKNSRVPRVGIKILSFDYPRRSF
jgi:hypothetical protein